MLRITVEEQHGWATIHLEGTLSGPWVDEVRRCWWDTLACPEQVMVDLESVTSMDDMGRALLAEMHRAGTQLHGRGLMTNYILEQIQNGSRQDGQRSL
jgi:anti-anti-sigma regulatory factor